MTNIAINGFGRIGRMFFRQVYSERSRITFQERGIEIVAINDLGDSENLAYLLKNDTVYGKFPKTVSVENGYLVVGRKKIKLLQEKDPEKLPWRDMNVDIVVESTGVFSKFDLAYAHIRAGAKRTIITAPAKDEDGDLGRTVLMGVNQDILRTVEVTSNGSCTTNAVSPVVQVLSETLGIEKAVLNTIHGYTATQSLVDGPVKGDDFRKGRAAAQNMIPSTTGAAISVARAIEELKDKFDGIAIRVPVVAGSIADITFIAKRNTSGEEVNDILEKASKESRWKGILKVTNEKLVSTDIIGEPFGAIVDASLTRVVGGNLVKVLSWYDNEYGYATTLLKHVKEVASLIS
jgi:glyceraldehyde 3-phosphate dehydrogenase